MKAKRQVYRRRGPPNAPQPKEHGDHEQQQAERRRDLALTMRAIQLRNEIRAERRGSK